MIQTIWPRTNQEMSIRVEDLGGLTKQSEEVTNATSDCYLKAEVIVKRRAVMMTRGKNIQEMVSPRFEVITNVF